MYGQNDDDVWGFFGFGDIITLPDCLRTKDDGNIINPSTEGDVAILSQLAGVVC
ncbi:MAG: hypothetical protein WC774_03830 [Candidatus Gracilibacteria bacterium]|jgi:hypothetical protein